MVCSVNESGRRTFVIAFRPTCLHSFLAFLGGDEFVDIDLCKNRYRFIL